MELLEPPKDFYLGGALCEWDDMLHGGVRSGVMSYVCFAQTITQRNLTELTSTSVISTCPNSDSSSKLYLNRPSSILCWPRPPPLHSPGTLYLPVFSCHCCHLYFYIIDGGNLFLQLYKNTLRAESVSHSSFSSPSATNTVCSKK